MKMYFIPLDPKEKSDPPRKEYALQVMKAVLLGLEGEGEITSAQHHLALEYLRSTHSKP